MANVNVNNDIIFPQAGSDNEGRKKVFISGETKATQNDTLTLTGANSVLFANLQIDATGVSEPATISGNVITLTSVTTGTVSGEVIIK